METMKKTLKKKTTRTTTIFKTKNNICFQKKQKKTNILPTRFKNNKSKNSITHIPKENTRKGNKQQQQQQRTNINTQQTKLIPNRSTHNTIRKRNHIYTNKRHIYNKNTRLTQTNKHDKTTQITLNTKNKQIE